VTFHVPFGDIFEETKLKTSFTTIEVVIMCSYDAWGTLITDFEPLYVDIHFRLGYHILANFWNEIFTIEWMFSRSHSFSTLHDFNTMFYETKLAMVGGISTQILCSMLYSSWIPLGFSGPIGFPYLFGDFDHMGKISYSCRSIIACISYVNMQVGVLVSPHFEYIILYTLEVEFVG